MLKSGSDQLRRSLSADTPITPPRTDDLEYLSAAPRAGLSRAPDARFDGINLRLSNLKEGQTGLAERVDDLGDRMGGVEGRLEKIEGHLGGDQHIFD
ncbi:MAG: hypothetical protein OXD50_10575 [Chloroflexi bacterium]|nr:hypothetical protein [Chloroflexota bacterium]